MAEGSRVPPDWPAGLPLALGVGEGSCVRAWMGRLLILSRASHVEHRQCDLQNDQGVGSAVQSPDDPECIAHQKDPEACLPPAF